MEAERERERGRAPGQDLRFVFPKANARRKSFALLSVGRAYARREQRRGRGRCSANAKHNA